MTNANKYSLQNAKSLDDLATRICGFGFWTNHNDDREPLKEKYPADEFNTEILSPIPLTDEILRKNGWVYNDEDEKFFPQTWVGGGLKLQGADDVGYRIVVTSDYDDEDTNSTPFILLYVHELQHALRLRKIEKEIEL